MIVLLKLLSFSNQHLEFGLKFWNLKTSKWDIWLNLIQYFLSSFVSFYGINDLWLHKECKKKPFWVDGARIISFFLYMAFFLSSFED